MPVALRRLACLLLVLVAGCAPAPAPEAAPPATASRYLYVWAGADSAVDKDFLAVIDADPTSASYGTMVMIDPQAEYTLELTIRRPNQAEPSRVHYGPARIPMSGSHGDLRKQPAAETK